MKLAARTLLPFFAMPIMLAVVCVGQAATSVDDYTLSERCGRLAKEHWEQYKTEWPQNTFFSKGFDPTLPIPTFQNHYHATLGKCYFMAVYNTGAVDVLDLRDLNDHKKVGYLAKVPVLIGRDDDADRITACLVLDKKCTSKKEWNALTKSMMEE